MAAGTSLIDLSVLVPVTVIFKVSKPTQLRGFSASKIGFSKIEFDSFLFLITKLLVSAKDADDKAKRDEVNKTF